MNLCIRLLTFGHLHAHRARELKRQTLMELINYINTPAGQKVCLCTVRAPRLFLISRLALPCVATQQLFTEPMMPLIVEMLVVGGIVS